MSKKADVSFKARTLTVSAELYQELEEMRGQQEEVLGLVLSWNNFLGLMVRKFKEDGGAANRRKAR